MIEFDVQFQNAQNMDVSFSESDTFSCSMDGVIVSDYPGPYEVEPTENTQSLITSGKILASDITVDAIPSDYVGSSIPHRSSDDLNASGDTISAPAGYYDEVASKPIAHGSAKTPDSTISVNPSISVNSAGLITATVSKNITITPTVTPGYIDTGTSGTITANGADTKQLTTQAGSTITPTESEQTAVAEGKFTTGDVKVGAISSTYVGSDIPRKGAADLTANGATVTAPAGYYASIASKAVASGLAGTPTASKGTVSNHSVSVTPSVTNTTGYITGGTLTGTAVTVGASELVSGTLSVTSSGTKDVTNYASASIPAGTAGTPTASKGTVNNHSISVTPSVTNSAGYISGGTKTGTAVSVSASEVTSGTKSITANGTGIDVTEYAAVDVAVPSGAPTLQTKTKSYTPSESVQSEAITADAGYDGLDEVDISVGAISSTYVGSDITRRTSSDLSASGATVTAPAGYYESQATKSVATGTATAPTTISGSQATLTTGTNTITLQKTLNVTPRITTAGYISSGTAGSALVSLNANVTTKAATTIYPSASDQSIASGTYTTGAQTIKGVTTSNILAANIKQGVVVTVGDSDDADRILSVTGTYSGGGGESKNAQVVQGTTRTTSSTQTAIGAEMTVSKTGTYDVYWSGFRSSTSASYTYGTQLFIDNVAYGTENTTWSNHVQNNHLTNVSLTANQKIRVRGRNSRGSSYYIYAPTLVIIEA